MLLLQHISPWLLGQMAHQWEPNKIHRDIGHIGANLALTRGVKTLEPLKTTQHDPVLGFINQKIIYQNIHLK